MFKRKTSLGLLALCLILTIKTFAKAMKPPYEKGYFRGTNLVDLQKINSTIKLNIRYATRNNFTGKPVYDEAKAFMQHPAAMALARVSQKLKPLGYGLLVFDAYRPWYVTKKFWKVTSSQNKKFVANPKKGSKHNRGCAVDLTLYDLKTGKEIPMTGAYDEWSPRSYVDYKGGTQQQRNLRDLLKRTMEEEGFQVYPYEWWHLRL